MTIQEKVETEKHNEDKIYLYKEGGFWKVYEKSAYLFYNNIKKYLVQKKFVKCVDSYVVYIGFPNSKIAELTRNYSVSIPDERTIVVEMGGRIDLRDFDMWKNLVEAKEIKTTEEKNNEQSDPEKEAIHRIKNFMLESANPIECLIFVKELKHLLSNGSI